MDTPNLVRNMAIIGHLHHGKTTFMDSLVKETHPVITSHGERNWDPHYEVRPRSRAAI